MGLKSAITGGIKGAVTGFVTGGPWGAAAGAGAGIVGGALQKEGVPQSQTGPNKGVRREIAAPIPPYAQPSPTIEHGMSMRRARVDNRFGGW